MARKKSEHEYLESFETIHPGLYEYEKFPEKFNQKTKINVYCKKHKFWFSMTINNIMNKHGCPKCGKENMTKTKGSNNQEKYKDIIEKNYSNSFDLSEIDYCNCSYDKNYVFVTCKKCGKRQPKTIACLVLNKAGCTCDKYNRMDWYYKNLRNEQIEKIKKFCNKAFGDRLELPNLEVEYMNIESKITCHCKKDNYTFLIKPNNLLYKYQGCPICSAKEKMSSFARSTMYFLEDKSIKYIPEFIISTNEYLKNKPYDFFLEDFNLLLEIDGDQHRRPAFGRTDEDVKKQQIIDKNKVIEGNKEGYLVLRLNTDDDFLVILEKYLENLKSSTTIPIREYTQVSGNINNPKGL